MLGVEVTRTPYYDTAELERLIEAFGRKANGGLIVQPTPTTWVHRKQIIALAARNRLPSISAMGGFVVGGGLISYGHLLLENWRGIASYVDKILRGARPADLPVQMQTRLQLVINLKTAKALGLTIPASLLARADRVLE